MVKKSALVCFAMWLVTAVVPMIALAQTVEENKLTADNAASEVAIRSIAEEFVKAYNAHDAKAVAELFLPQATSSRGFADPNTGQSERIRAVRESCFPAGLQD